MEALSVEKQADIRKMSSDRLRAYLLKEGRDEEEIMTWDRSQLMAEWAIEVGKREEEEMKTGPVFPAEIDYDLQKRCLEFEIYKYEEDRKEREEERKERRENEERKERKEEEERKE